MSAEAIKLLWQKGSGNRISDERNDDAGRHWVYQLHVTTAHPSAKRRGYKRELADLARRPDERSSQSTLNEKQNKKPIGGTKMKTSISKVDETDIVHQVAYANTLEKPSHTHTNYTVEVRHSADGDHNFRQQQWIMGKIPDVQNISEQFDEPDTFWECALCCKELTTIVALAAHVDVMHQGKLLLYDCKLCKFQTGEARLLQEQEAETHNMARPSNLLPDKR